LLPLWQCYVRKDVTVPRADLCEDALGAIDERLTFIKPQDGDAWFPDPMVGVEDVETSLTAVLEFARLPPVMDAIAIPTPTGAIGVGIGANVAPSANGAPIFPVTMAVPIVPQVSKEIPPRTAAPLEEFDTVDDEPNYGDLSDYEKKRAQNIESNKKALQQLGIEQLNPPKSKVPRKKKARDEKDTEQTSAASKRPRREPTPLRSEPVRSPPMPSPCQAHARAASRPCRYVARPCQAHALPLAHDLRLAQGCPTEHMVLLD
jgi:hypothetical protein